MKKIVIVISLVSLFALTVFAQTPRPAGAAAAAQPTGGTGAEGKIALVNSAAFNGEIMELRAKIEALGSELEPARKELEAMQKQIEDIKTNLQTKGTTVNEATKQQWLEQGQELEKTFKRKSEDYEAKLQKRGAEVIQPINGKIVEALSKYAAAKGIAIVLDFVAAQNNGLLLYAKDTTNITDDFVKEYNKANPAAAGTAPAKK